MGHDICIDENTGKASIFVVKEPAWHGLGQVVPEALTAKDAIIQAGLDWDVVKSPVYFGEDKTEIPNRHAIVRTDNNVLQLTAVNYFKNNRNEYRNHKL